MLVAVVFAGCNDVAPEGMCPAMSAYNLKVDDNYLAFTAHASSQTIHVESKNTPWRITGIPDWITVSPESGNKSGDIMVSVTHHNSWDNDRNCTLRLVSEAADFKYDRTIKVLQYKQDGVSGIFLNKSFITLAKDETEILIATVAPTDASDKSLVWTSNNTYVATVDNNGKVTAVNYGTATITATSVADASKKATCTVNVVDSVTNGYEYVDLGLTSGLLWATMNVGASSPSDYGNYYAWGETTTKTTYMESNYTYTATPTTLPMDKDVAHVNWGGNWRMPTQAEFLELYSECSWTWTTQGGKNGYLVKSKKNSNSIFLPAAGFFGFLLNSAGSYGYYWSSTLYTSNTSFAYRLYFDSSSIDPSTNYYRYVGRSVRPVLKK